MPERKLAQEKRYQLLERSKSEVFDLLVIGGGIHGAAIAREAALSRLSVLLVEARDYASGSSSRSSKMIHGGIRYLENGDWQLVRQSLLERARLIENAPHLTRWTPFLFPIIPQRTRSCWQIKLGLSFYDFLSKGFFKGNQTGESLGYRVHHALSESAVEISTLREHGLSFSKVFSYADGQMDDARITVETILDAQESSATTLNYVCCIAAERCLQRNIWLVELKDTLSGLTWSVSAKYIVNAAGTSVPQVEKLFYPETTLAEQVVYSRGSHLLFNFPWKLPGLILPTEVFGRYYFVWPYFSPFSNSTLVGTTDVMLEGNEENPVASAMEVDQLLGYLKKDLPHLPFSKSTLYQVYSGVRILGVSKRSQWALRKNVSTRLKVSEISRHHVIHQHSHYCSVVGGKFTTARLLAEECISNVLRQRGALPQSYLSRERRLPGGVGFNQQMSQTLVRELVQELQRREQNFSEEQLTNQARVAVQRFGVRSRRLMREPYYSAQDMIEGAQALLSEIRLCIIDEQALTVSDVLRRRLGLSLEPEAGQNLISLVIKELEILTGRSAEELRREGEGYLQEMKLR